MQSQAKQLPHQHRAPLLPSNILSPPSTTSDILSQPIPANLLPLDLLPRDRQLPPQPLERALAQLTKRLVQILLVFLLRHRNLPYDVLLADSTKADVLFGEQPHVAVLVVVHVDFDAAGEGARRRVVDVRGAPSAVPVICGRVLICDGQDGEGGVVGGGEDTVRGFGVVFRGVRVERFNEALAISQLSALGAQIACSSTRVCVKGERTLGPPADSLGRSSAPRLPCPLRGRSRMSFVFLHHSTVRRLGCCIR